MKKLSFMPLSLSANTLRFISVLNSVSKFIHSAVSVRLSVMAVLIVLVNLSVVSTVHAEKVSIIKPNTTSTVSSSDDTQEEGDNTDENAEATKNLEISPDSLAAEQIPTPEQLSIANQELLTENAKLQREINDLETQVNVLVNERSGQIFLYGVFTVIISFIAGAFVIGLFANSRKERW